MFSISGFAIETRIFIWLLLRVAVEYSNSANIDGIWHGRADNA